MAIDTEYVWLRLFERNPDLDEDIALEAFNATMEDDPRLENAWTAQITAQAFCREHTFTLRRQGRKLTARQRRQHSIATKFKTGEPLTYSDLKFWGELVKSVMENRVVH